MILKFCSTENHKHISFHFWFSQRGKFINDDISRTSDTGRPKHPPVCVFKKEG